MQVLTPLADGCEEMESVIIVDIFRRAKWHVASAGLKPGPVTASRGVKIVPDALWGEISPDSFDILAIPGGARGVENLRRDERVLDAVRRFDESGKTIAAVCAGPLVLQEAGILAGRKVTCHPGVESQLTAVDRLPEPVVVDGNLVTSQGPGTSFDFALTVIQLIEGPERAASIAREMVFLRPPWV